MRKVHPLLVHAGAALTLLPFLGTLLLTRASAADMYAVSFNPVADTFVKQLFPDNRYGSFTNLRVDGFPIVHSYLRFSVQGLGGAQVVKAQLQIYAELRSGIGISVFAVSDNTWNESTLTYSSAPAMGAALSSSAPFAADSWVPLDVSTYVTGEGTYSFGVTTPGVTSIKLASRGGRAGHCAPANPGPSGAANQHGCADRDCRGHIHPAGLKHTRGTLSTGSLRHAHSGAATGPFRYAHLAAYACAFGYACGGDTPAGCLRHGNSSFSTRCIRYPYSAAYRSQYRHAPGIANTDEH